MKDIDTDQNGKISFKEYMQWVLGKDWWVEGTGEHSGACDASAMFQGKLWRLQKDDAKRKTKVVATLGVCLDK